VTPAAHGERVTLFTGAAQGGIGGHGGKTPAPERLQCPQQVNAGDVVVKAKLQDFFRVT
jgi:hypothetical protein